MEKPSLNDVIGKAIGSFNARRMPRQTIWIAIILLALGAAGFTAFKLYNSTGKTSSGYIMHLSADGLAVTGKVTLASGGDVNANSKIDAGNTLNFVFVVTNKNQQAARGVTIDTGVQSKLVAYIHDVRGVTGVAENNLPTILFKNLVILPNETQRISFSAQSLYSRSTYEIHVHPVLIDPSNTVVYRGLSQAITVAGALAPSQANVTKIGG